MLRSQQHCNLDLNKITIRIKLALSFSTASIILSKSEFVFPHTIALSVLAGNLQWKSWESPNFLCILIRMIQPDIEKWHLSFILKHSWIISCHFYWKHGGISWNLSICRWNQTFYSWIGRNQTTYVDNICSLFIVKSCCLFLYLASRLSVWRKCSFSDSDDNKKLVEKDVTQSNCERMVINRSN